MGEVLEGTDQRTRGVDLGPALGALTRVRLEGRRAESDLTVQKEVDLFGK